MKDSKGMDSGQYKKDKYMKMMEGKTGKVMKNHGNTTSISTDANQERGKVQVRKMDYRGTSDKAFDYKY